MVARRACASAARHGAPALQAILLNKCGACARGSGRDASPGSGPRVRAILVLHYAINLYLPYLCVSKMKYYDLFDKML